MNDTIHIGVVGAGNWAKTAHLPAMARQKNVVVAGITDVDPQRAADLGRIYDIPVFPNIDAMLAGVYLDAVDIITSRGQHFEPVMKGAAKGLSILCEKPLGHNLKEARQLYQAAKGLVTQVGFTFRYSPAVRYLRDLVLQGAIGEVYAFQGFEENGQLLSPLTPLPRLGFSRKTDSGALQGYGSHLLDLGSWILGDYLEVIGDMATYIKERPILGEPGKLPVDVDDSTIVLARFKSGAQAVMQFSKIAVGNAPGVEMRIFGSKSAIWVRLEETPEGFEHLWISEKAEGYFKPLGIPPQYLQGYEPALNWQQYYFNKLMPHFLERARTGDRSTGAGDFLDGMRSQEVLEAIELSHFERRWVRVDEVN